MIVRHFLALILCSSLAFGQAAATMPQAAAAPSTTPDTAAAISPDTPVITVKGVCDPPAADCTTVITKAQFEAIISAFPQMKTQQRQVASSYGQLLAMSAEAKKRALDKSPRVQVRTKISDMQALAGELRDTMQDDAGKISDADAQKYYDDHKTNYEQAEVQRLIIPKEPQPAGKDDDKDADAPKAAAKKPVTAAAKAAAAKAAPAKAAPAKPKAMDEAGLAALAAKLRARAAAGEDFSKLQAEAFAAANIKGGAPDTKISKATRAQLPPNVFDLKTGDVSELIPDARAFFVFKMGAKTTVSLDDAKSDVKTALKNERLQSSLKAVSDSSTTTLNDAYFGPEPAPGAAPGGRQPASAPPSN